LAQCLPIVNQNQQHLIHQRPKRLTKNQRTQLINILAARQNQPQNQR